MIKIEAIVRPERINDVTAALEAIGCGGFHFANVTGQGQQRGVEVFTGRGAALTHRSSLPKTLLVTVVPEEQKEQVLEAIVEAARSSEEGAVGDGKIFVTTVNEVVRVRTRERDLDALSTNGTE
ncbi:MAG: P-II family nitrogen regulator [Chloroflexi bacterium]|nr:P-II family nitrogen regulator [Chloroflexota bacterium]MCH8235753.1 P-II family nitrogen regulator [Chloroflexota bacterium]MCH8817618.1 P-II family nitrogen regulator [Chloroflexota bacterium]